MIDARSFNTGGLETVVIAAVCAVAMAGPTFAAVGFHEDFSSDPIASGRWSMMSGENVNRFTYDAVAHTLTAAYDSGQATARLVRPLGRTLNETDSFRLVVRLMIKSDGFHSDDTFNSQISFGLLNVPLTGPDRAGYSSAPKAFDQLSFDYFPVTNDTPPSVIPTIICRNTGQSYWSRTSTIIYTWGSETELGEGNGEISDLPQDEILTVDIVYRGDEYPKVCTMRIYDSSMVPLLINSGGGLDDDPATITTHLSIASGFDVNAFGLLLWKDTLTNSSIVTANLVYYDVQVIWPGFGDFDGNETVDDADLMIFENCAAGPAVPVAAGCAMCDFDRDGDVDSDDFALFQRSIGTQ